MANPCLKKLSFVSIFSAKQVVLKELGRRCKRECGGGGKSSNVGRGGGSGFKVSRVNTLAVSELNPLYKV